MVRSKSGKLTSWGCSLSRYLQGFATIPGGQMVRLFPGPRGESRSCGNSGGIIQEGPKDGEGYPPWNEHDIAPENRVSQKEASIPTIHFQVLCQFWEE